MKLISNKIFLEHNTGTHPERKERLLAFGDLPETQLQFDESFLTLVHTPEHIEHIRKLSAAGEPVDADTLTSRGSFNAAVAAVNASILASQTGDFALVRPPGHHAFSNHASGFCLFNNIAIAVQKLVTEGKRVCILDIDGHLGDGTEAFFYSSNKALYWSLHQFPAFPGKGTVDEIGEGEGTGYTINIPLAAGTGDDIYLAAIERFLPAVQQFAPDVIAVSAGFDGYLHDPLLSLRLSMNAYYSIGSLLHQHFSSIFAVLEGGYNIEALPKCVMNFIDGINGDQMKYTEEKTDSTILTFEAYEVQAEQLQKNLAVYWKF